MKRNFLSILCFLSLAVLFSSSSCNDKRNPNPIPICAVNFVIYLDSFDQDLSIGNVKTFNDKRGYTGCFGSSQYKGGVVVYRFADDEFFAYDMACPVDHFYGCMVIEFSDMARVAPLEFECLCCKAKFNILDGYPKGSGNRYPMRKYKVTKERDRQFRVQN
ncbi:MAG: hypothetical protein FWE63_04720 [Bacteroidales bacterium]|nr:hypothetical protein [Bacteroidales bacterium]